MLVVSCYYVELNRLLLPWRPDDAWCMLLALLLMQGRVRVDRGSGELRLLVKVNAQGQGLDARKIVKDLKQLSGESCAQQQL
jgi:hypothetical protein